MKKTIWITGIFVVLGIVAALLYFSLFREKSGVMPEGTFVKKPDSGYFFADEPEEKRGDGMVSEGGGGMASEEVAACRRSA